ncbi:hypothetical protein [Glutamicibacter sp. TV12E]|uniref:hypothetical protein n=1 Tax=Glutamicibacter sp. TV12E TaxID=3446362 RepID=UPI00403350D5
MNKKSTVSEAVSTNDYRVSLVALRDRLATDIDNPETPAAVRAQCAKQLQSVLADIQAIPDPDKFSASPLDQILNGEDK